VHCAGFEMAKSSEVPPTMSTLASVLGEPSVLQVDSSIAYNSYLHSSRPASTLSEEHAAFAAAKADLHKQQQAAHEMVFFILHLLNIAEYPI
jgi:hypothetical protein